MSLLIDLQQEAAARLTAQAFFSDAGNPSPRPVAVLTEQIGSLPARVTQSLGQLGIVCVLLTPTARTTNLHYPRPYFDEIQLVARTQENVLLNRSAKGTGQPASLVAEAAAWFLHGFVPGAVGGPLRFTEIRLVADPRLLVYETVFTAQAGMHRPPARATADLAPSFLDRPSSIVHENSDR